MKPRELIDFLGALETLKTNARHAVTRGGAPETVAAHSWRLAVMALLCAPEIEGVDADRLVRMCLVHDFGEAVTGDIPSFYKTGQDEEREDAALVHLLRPLPEPQRGELLALFSEMRQMRTREARLYKALDKLEAVLQHNESDISTWIPLEYQLNLAYGEENAEEFPFLKALRALMREDSLKKIAEAEEKGA
ncbi:MAG: HD domain-containing protein [Clostridia bacterium]|nr:HD domain-containing protein [Clostridia bacterium]